MATSYGNFIIIAYNEMQCDYEICGRGLFWKIDQKNILKCDFYIYQIAILDLETEKLIDQDQSVCIYQSSYCSFIRSKIFVKIGFGNEAFMRVGKSSSLMLAFILIGRVKDPGESYYCAKPSSEYLSLSLHIGSHKNLFKNLSLIFF